MSEQRKSDNGPLTSHYQKYSSVGLFNRYVNGRIRTFKSRLVFSVIVALVLSVLATPVVALVCFVLATVPDFADCLYLRHAGEQLRRNPSLEKRVRTISTVTSAIHAVGVSVCAAAPIWATYIQFGLIG